ncbi:MAG: cbb3-type cytochrome c oxidase N-terminal domain-containing protein [Phycisphaerales bacterium]
MSQTNHPEPPKADADGSLLDHAYDGIQEFDNPLPSWWTSLWALSVVFSVAYVAWFHLGEGASVEEQYEAAATRHVERLVAALGDVGSDDAGILTVMHREDMMAGAASIFRGNCAQCHSQDGGGNIGPNLTDEAFINVATPSDLYSIIADGIAGTSMPAWSNRLSEPQILLVAGYVASLRGTEPAQEIAAQGDPIPTWEEFERDLGLEFDAEGKPIEGAGAETDSSASANELDDVDRG